MSICPICDANMERAYVDDSGVSIGYVCPNEDDIWLHPDDCPICGKPEFENHECEYDDLMEIIPSLKAELVRTDEIDELRFIQAREWGDSHERNARYIEELEAKVDALDAAHKIGLSMEDYIKEAMRIAYLNGINDHEEGCSYWCEQGSRERIDDLIEDGILDDIGGE